MHDQQHNEMKHRMAMAAILCVIIFCCCLWSSTTSNTKYIDCTKSTMLKLQNINRMRIRSIAMKFIHLNGGWKKIESNGNGSIARERMNNIFPFSTNYRRYCSWKWYLMLKRNYNHKLITPSIWEVPPYLMLYTIEHPRTSDVVLWPMGNNTRISHIDLLFH